MSVSQARCLQQLLKMAALAPDELKASLIQRLRRCALRDQRRMDGFLSFFFGANTWGHMYLQQLESLRASMPAVPNLERMQQLTWSLYATRNSLVFLDLQVAFSRAHAGRMRGEYAAMYRGVLDCFNRHSPSRAAASAEGSSSGRREIREQEETQPPAAAAAAEVVTARDLRRLMTLNEVLIMKEEEQASWRPNGVDMDWGAALLSSASVSFPRAIGDLVPAWPQYEQAIDEQMLLPLLLVLVLVQLDIGK
ncbi:hypothetical protein Efla_004688 [Eimeria flavescens]